MTLSDVLSKKAKETPEKICIKFEKRKLTYSEIEKAVTQIARGLKELSLNTSDRVAILMENCPEYIISYFAILRAGGIAVPINTFLTPGEIFYILNDCSCKILIYSKKFSSHAEEIKRNISDLKVVVFDEISQIPPSPPLLKGPGSRCREALQREAGGFDEDSVAVFLYTSGTTGFPKGAMLTHKNLLTNTKACMKVMDLSNRDRVLLFLPLFHSFTFTVCVIVPIYVGATIVLLKGVKPFSKVINSIFKDRITLFVAVPTIYNILARKRMPFFLKYFFKFFLKIRICVSGAAPLPEETFHIFESHFKIPILEGYGLTEASPVVSVNPVHGMRKPNSVGLPLPGIEVAVVGEDGRMLVRGETGELIVKGQNVMKGYFNREEETALVLKDGWLYTGDIARIDEDGYVYIVDRKKDLIIHDGMNIYPREVEDVLVKHALIEECAMVGIPDGKGSEIPTLFIKKKENALLDEKAIREHLKGRVAPFKTPRRIVFVEEFPKTATGKIKKVDLRRWKI